MTARARRRAGLTPLSRRLTPREVAQLWFRRGADFAALIHAEHPGFPNPGPDGLYLLAQIEEWFDRFHGRRQTAAPLQTSEDEALRVAKYGRGQNPPSSH